MQLNGVGGGLSSTSKVAIVEQSSRPGHDVDYTFGQVDMKSGRVDWSGSCGNLAAAVALFALEEGLVARSRAGVDLVKIFQANLQYSIHVSVPHVDAAQDQTIPGVEAPGSAITVDFLHPRVGNRPLLPTGNAKDVLHLGACRDADLPRAVEASLVCAANPTIFVRAADLALDDPFPPHSEARHLQPIIDEIRRQGAQLMGVDLTDAVRVSWLAPPCKYTSTAGIELEPHEVDLTGSVTTPGRLYHHAFTGTGAINLACLAAIPDSIAHALLTSASPPGKGESSGAAGARKAVSSRASVRLGQPAGVMTVQAHCRRAGNLQGAGQWVAESAGFVRTARLLFSGHVHV